MKLNNIKLNLRKSATQTEILRHNDIFLFIIIDCHIAMARNNKYFYMTHKNFLAITQIISGTYGS